MMKEMDEAVTNEPMSASVPTDHILSQRSPLI